MTETAALRPPARDRTHYLYIAVVVAALAGVVVGLVAPAFAAQLKPVGNGFVNLIKMMISPIIFCTIVLGIGSVRRAASVGKVGGLAIAYFLAMSTVALAIGLVVGNLIHPGAGMHLVARAPTLPTVAALATLPMPSTMVQKMIGLIIILIRLTKPVPNGLSVTATLGATRPTTMPSRTAPMTARER